MYVCPTRGLDHDRIKSPKNNPVCLHKSESVRTFATSFRERHLISLSGGVMVTRKILALKFGVQVPAGQQNALKYSGL